MICLHQRLNTLKKWGRIVYRHACWSPKQEILPFVHEFKEYIKKDKHITITLRHYITIFNNKISSYFINIQVYVKINKTLFINLEHLTITLHLTHKCLKYVFLGSRVFLRQSKTYNHPSSPQVFQSI